VRSIQYHNRQYLLQESHHLSDLFCIENESHNRLIGEGSTTDTAPPLTNLITENGNTLRCERISRHSSENDMGRRKSWGGDRQLVDAGMAGESVETADTADIRGRVSPPTFPDGGDISQNSGHGLFLPSGGGYNVRLQPGTTKLVEASLAPK
jgi:hypothetical protein